jgi:predicted RNase H-like HicB family nuclease
MTQGETLEEVESNLREAVEAWLEAGEVNGGEKEGQVVELAV